MKTGSGGTTVSVRVADCEAFPLVAVIVTVYVPGVVVVRVETVNIVLFLWLAARVSELDLNETVGPFVKLGVIVACRSIVPVKLFKLVTVIVDESAVPKIVALGNGSPATTVTVAGLAETLKLAAAPCVTITLWVGDIAETPSASVTSTVTPKVPGVEYV
jgi:hypothetical protein